MYALNIINSRFNFKLADAFEEDKCNSLVWF